MYVCGAGGATAAGGATERAAARDSGARAGTLCFDRYVCVKLSTGHTHTHTPTEYNTPNTDTHTHTHTHDKNNTPNPQTNTSHKHLTSLEGGATTVRATSRCMWMCICMRLAGRSDSCWRHSRARSGTWQRHSSRYFMFR